jgi:mannose-6-phosphate isomerase-like protein (cupin superfamily)
MPIIVSLFWSLVLAQAASTGPAAAPAPAPAAVVTAETIEATMRQSIANNTLDKKMNETPVKGGIFRVGIVHRTAPEPRALLHDDLTEVYQIIQGSGTLMTGGTPQAPQPVSDPPNLGPTPSYYVTQAGGVSQKVKPRDVVIIPAGLPHRFSQLDGPIEYVIYRFEVSPVR